MFDRKRKMQHHVQDDFLRELGHIVVSFSALESTVQFFLMALIEESQRVGRSLTAEMSFRNMRAAIVSIFIEKHGKGPEFDQIKNLVSRAGKCEEERNRIFHSEWTCGEVDVAFHVTRSKETAREKHGLSSNFQDYSIQQLRDFGDSLFDLAADYEGFLEELCQREMAKDTRPIVHEGGNIEGAEK